MENNKIPMYVNTGNECINLSEFESFERHPEGVLLKRANGTTYIAKVLYNAFTTQISVTQRELYSNLTIKA